MKKALFIGILYFLVISCGNSKETQINLNQSENISTKETNIDQLKTEASRLNGGGSIKTVELKNGKATITYVKSYREYKELNPQSMVTENSLKSYWSTGNGIQKALVASPARLMKNLNFIDEVKIILPFENNVYEIDIKKSELEKFVGKDFKTITNDWNKNFIDPFVYDKKGRQKFFDKFGTIK